MMFLRRRHCTPLNACKRNLKEYRFANFILIIVVLCIFIIIHQFSNAGDFISYYLYSVPLPLSLKCNAGRLGNQMCSYATLYGLSALNQRRHFKVLKCNMQHLTPYFTELSAEKSELLYIKKNPWNLVTYRRPEDRLIPKDTNYLDGYKYPCSYTFFDHVKYEIRREFQFSGDLQQHAQTVLRKANVRNLRKLTYVGMHVRRGDYLEHWLKPFGGVEVNLEYFKRAVEHFRSKYNPVVFVLVSDDRLWCIENLAARFGIFVTDESPSPAHDLALLANCNHTIITYGTFGFWGAYLAGGEVVYFDKYLATNTSFAKNKFLFEKMYPPRWKGLATENISKVQWKYFDDNAPA